MLAAGIGVVGIIPLSLSLNCSVVPDSTVSMGVGFGRILSILSAISRAS